MVDETTSISNTEQLVVCLRYVDDNLDVLEEIIAWNLPTSTVIVTTITDILLCMNLSISNCRGQCYNGASSMSGSRSGVAIQLSKLEPKALYTDSYGHSLNLAIQDTLKGSKIMRDTLDTVYEITKLIKKSPKREAILKKNQDDVKVGSPGIRMLCPTRWTVRAEALSSITENYGALEMTWDVAMDETLDTEMEARIGGVSAQMENSISFLVELGRKFLTWWIIFLVHFNPRQFQHVKAKILLTLLTKIRDEDSFNLFWEYLEKRDHQSPWILQHYRERGKFLASLKLVRVFLNILKQPINY